MASSDRPNLLLITSDQQRADTVGVLGSRVARTPNLDRLAGEGVAFSRACVQNVVCIPSRACIQTGRYTHQHGVRHMEPVIDSSPGLPPWETTFMERLQAAGYETGATGKIHMMPERGFDWMEIVGGKGQRWTQSSGQSIGPAPLGRQYAAWLEARIPGGYERLYEQRRRGEYRRYHGAIVNDLPLEAYVETYILEQAIGFMRRDRDRPFFLWCGFCGPHGPHDPPASHAGLYPPDGIPLPETLEADLSDKPEWIRKRAAPLHAPPWEEPVLRRFMAYYYGLVTLIDDYVGRLVATMAGQGLLENTLVVYTSDHGEMLGDFRLTGKGNFYEPVLRVPMIVRPPGGTTGRRFDGLVEVMDAAPTLLDYAGVPVPPQMSASSLRPVIEGGHAGREAVLSEFTNADPSVNGKCLRTERYKLVRWDTPDGGEFYDLEEDPHECCNRYDDPAVRGERDALFERLLCRLMQTETGYTAGREHPY